MARLIYADHNATTPLSESAKTAMVAALDKWGNPSSSHGIGREAREPMEKARQQVAAACGVEPKTIVFTSGGSEANAQCILGLRFAFDTFRILTSDTEHSSVRDCVQFLEKRGVAIDRVRILPNGEIDLNHFEDLLVKNRPPLVSLMAANNETGVLLPVAEVAALCKAHGAVFHCDCVQSFGKAPASDWNHADLISISAHKIYGPKGVGAMVVRGGPPLVALPFGGTQEVKRRGGTQNVLGIIGFGAAAEALSDSSASPAPLAALRDHFEQSLLHALPGVSVNGASAARVANTSNIRFEGIVSEVLLSILDLAGVCVSAGSACSSGSINPSPVLMSMGLTKEQARESVRFSWGRTTTREEVDTVVGLVVDHVRRIRGRRTTENRPRAEL
jgi:cysteine desulfurase